MARSSMHDGRGKGASCGREESPRTKNDARSDLLVGKCRRLHCSKLLEPFWRRLSCSGLEGELHFDELGRRSRWLPCKIVRYGFGFEENYTNDGRQALIMVSNTIFKLSTLPITFRIHFRMLEYLRFEFLTMEKSKSCCKSVEILL